MMQEKNNNPTLIAIKELKGNPNATLSDSPWQRPTLAEDVQAIKKAGEDAREIYEKREEILSSDSTLYPQKP